MSQSQQRKSGNTIKIEAFAPVQNLVLRIALAVLCGE